MTSSAAERPLRADAARNREKIMATARDVFAERGLAVTMDDIARAAGLGTGTVYRRFVDREALVEALFEERLEAAVAFAEECLREVDSWVGFVRFVTRTCEDMAGDRGLRQVMLSSELSQERLGVERGRLLVAVRLLIERAQIAGELRADLTAEDVPLIFLMLGTVQDFAADIAPGLWRRYLATILAGFRPSLRVGVEVPPPPLSDADLRRAMGSWRGGRR